MPLLICDRPIHPLAKLFPPLPPDEFEKLKVDIQRNGQLEPVWLDEDGRVLDGRHRLRACEELGIGATLMRLREIDPKISESDFVWSKNILRRHLSDGQRAAIAHHWADEIKRIGKEARLSNLKKGTKKPEGAKTPFRGKSRKVIAQQAGVSEHTVRQVEEVAKHKPELLPKVESGEIALKDAHKQIIAACEPAPMSRSANPHAPRSAHRLLQDWVRPTLHDFERMNVACSEPDEIARKLQPDEIDILRNCTDWLQKLYQVTPK